MKKVIPLRNQVSRLHSNSENHHNNQHKRNIRRRQRDLSEDEYDQSKKSEQSSSEEDDENEKDNRKSTYKKQNRNESSSEDSDEEEENQKRDRQRKLQQKKQIEQLKQKNKLVNETKRKLGEKEQVIENLNNKLDEQHVNLNKLNQQNEILKVKTNQLDTVMQEKQYVETHFAEQMQKVEEVKKYIKNRRSTLFNDKTEQFQQALQKKSFGYQVGSSFVNFLSSLIFLIENNYLLSKQVYFISNSTGQKSEVFFSSNAYLINIYCFSIVVFIPFFVKYFIETEFNSFEKIFLNNYSPAIGSYFIISNTIFFISQIILAYKRFIEVKQKEVREEAKSGLQINSFRIAFAEWNWRIRYRNLVQKNQYALVLYAQSFFNYDNKKIGLKEDHSMIKDIIIDFICLFLMIGSMIITAILHYKGYLLDIISTLFISEIIHGTVIAIIGKIFSQIIKLLMKQVDDFNSNQINSSKYNKKFFSQFLPAIVSILITYNTFLSQDQLTIHLNIFSTKIPFNPDKFDCPEQQTAHFLFGLAIGHFIVNIVWQYLLSIWNYIFSKQDGKSAFRKQIEFSTMEAQIPLIVQNMIILALIPFSAFAIFLALFIFEINFLNEWFIIQKVKLPQYKGAPKSLLRVQQSFFYNLSLIFIFCCYAFYYTNSFSTEKDTIGKYCNPYYEFKESIYGEFKNKIYSNSVIRVLYDIITWYPLLLVLLLAYIGSHQSSQGLIGFWKQEINNKKKEANGVKIYYEQKIERLEDRIKQTSSAIQNIGNNINNEAQYNHSSSKRTPENRRSEEFQNSKNSSQFTLIIDTEHNGRFKSNSHSAMQSSQVSTKFQTPSLKFIEEEQDDDYHIQQSSQGSKLLQKKFKQ